MSKTIFISQPMGGLSDEQVLQERTAAISKAKALLGEDVAPLETFFDDFCRQQSHWTIWPGASSSLQRPMWQSLLRAGRMPAAAVSNTSAQRITASP